MSLTEAILEGGKDFVSIHMVEDVLTDNVSHDFGQHTCERDRSIVQHEMDIAFLVNRRYDRQLSRVGITFLSSVVNTDFNSSNMISTLTLLSVCS